MKHTRQPFKPVRGANVVGPVIRRLRRAARPRITHMDLIARLEILGVPISEPMLSKIENQQRAVLDYEVRAFAAALFVPLEELYP
ncbi:MAG: XRE family transcriptional regulator [Opitutaceae bacterium]|nr:XRE family transcriptional regulator [Opitutaceae bacterium]